MFPLLFAVTMGMIELGLLYKDLHNLNETTRAAARIGSTASREPDYFQTVLDTAIDELEGRFEGDNLRRMVIFNAEPATGLPVVSGSLDTCQTDCYRFDFNAGTGSWDHVAGTAWDWSTQRACGRPTDNDYLGVYIEAYHPWVSRLFGEGKTVTGLAVFRLEPVTTTEACSP